MGLGQGLTSALTNFSARKRLLGSREEYRALAPVCSAIEINSKNAIPLCNKLLKKQPDHHIVLALKTVALLLGPRPVPAANKTEILSTVEFLKNHANGAGLGDPDVLMFFGWVLADIGRGDEMLAVLAKATQRHPENEDVCVEAFQHYCRVNEYRSAQQISMRMQRTFKSSKYLWWSVMMILLQVSADLSNPANDILLSLAERQISSHYSSLRTTADLNPTPTTTPPNGKLEIEAAASKAAEAQEEGEKAVVKAPGRDKGKGKATSPTTETVTSTPKPSSPAPRLLEFDSTHEFFLVTRFLELRLLHAAQKPTPLPSPSAIILPSLPLPAEEALSVRQTLLAHFASKEAERWCERGLGHEIWRREVELRHGSVNGGEWLAAWDRLSRSLETGDSNWHTMLYLIRVAFSLAEGSSKAYWGQSEVKKPVQGPTEEGVELLRQSRVLFRGLADDGDKGRKERGFLLGLLEIARESRWRDWEQVDALLPLIEEYFERFSTKMCCFDDLLPYLTVLDAAERASLATQMSVVCDGSGDLSLLQSQRVINGLKVARFVAPDSSEESENAAAEAYLQRYFDALPLGKGLPATEVQPADDFALLAGQAYVAAWNHSKHRSYLEKAVALLDYAALRSKHKYQIRILLINLTRLLGASSLSLTHYRILGIKSIQYDTLSHLVLGRASTFSVAAGNDPGVLEEALKASKWYVTGEHEATEMCVRAFSFHNFTKVEDFSTFQGRLSLSLPKFLLRIETLRMRIVGGSLDAAATKEAVDELTHMVAHKDDKLSDNRDFKTLPNFQPESEPSIWEGTNVGPRSGMHWLRAFVVIYAHFLAPAVPTIDVEEAQLASPALTASETALLWLSSRTRTALSAALDDTAADEAVLSFFKEQGTHFTEAVEDTAMLPWELLHIAAVGLEGYCLLDLAIEQRIAQLGETKAPDHAKLSKKLRTLRTAARDLTRVLTSKLTSHGKKVAKERAKTSVGLSSLKAFPLLDEDHITNFSHALVESRRAMAEGLAAAMHRRCLK